MRISVNGTTLHYRDDDFAEPWRPHDAVVLLHGYLRNGNFWRPWVPPLASEFRVVRFDMRGMGGSADPGPNYRYSLDGLAEDYVGFLDALGLGTVHAVAESLGGMVSATAAAKHPDRFKSLTLISTPVTIEENSSRAMASGFPSWREAVETLGVKGHWLATRKAQGELGEDAARDEYFANEAARTALHVVIALSQAIPGSSIAGRAPNIAAPTLLLAPGESPHTNAGQQSALERLIPGACLKTYPDAVHGMFYVRPEQLVKDTLEFLRYAS